MNFAPLLTFSRPFFFCSHLFSSPTSSLCILMSYINAYARHAAVRGRYFVFFGIHFLAHKLRVELIARTACKQRNESNVIFGYFFFLLVGGWRMCGFGKFGGKNNAFLFHSKCMNMIVISGGRSMAQLTFTVRKAYTAYLVHANKPRSHSSPKTHRRMKLKSDKCWK